MKVVFISSMLPSGHFSQYISAGLNKLEEIDLIVYTDKSPKNLAIKSCGKIRNIWSKSPFYIFDILSNLKKDRPSVVHIQQELNMYGGLLTVLEFPILVLMIRLMGIKVITTIHAAVFKKQIDNNFIRTFNKNPKLIKPIFLSTLFHYLFFFSSFFSNKIIVHSTLSKKILTKDYSVDKDKTIVIQTAIPKKEVNNDNKNNYFFYFGYMVRRKGLNHLLSGFAKFIKENPKSQFKLILAGGVIKGQEKSLEEIKGEINNLGLNSKVEIKGFIEEKQQDKLYQNAYAVVIPAILSMGSSGPLYHAQSYGKCVIATKIGHFLCDIKDKETGILTSNKDWAKAFSFAVNNKSLVKKIEKNVISLKKKRTPLETAKKYYRVYSSY